MISQQVLQENWSEIKGKVRSRWGALTDHDLDGCDGNGEQLVSAIQRKTGELRDTIEHYFDELCAESPSVAGRAGESVRAYARQAVSSIQETSHQAAASVREGYDGAQALVRHRPAQSLVVCFGVGLIAGTLLGLTLHSR